MSENIKLTITILITVLATAGGFFTGKLTNKPEQVIIERTVNDCSSFNEERGGGYTFINPLLECDNYRPSQLNSVVDMETKVSEYIDQVKANHTADYVSVYFRDLNFGPWMGINEKELFAPASLLKVPILIAVLKKAQTEPALLNQKIKYPQRIDKDIEVNIVDTNTLKPGASYTVDELLIHMIQFSDNDAMQLLLRIIGNNFFYSTMKDMGINLEGKSADDNSVSAKDFSSFFRMLFNATYLNRDMSEKALAILSKTTFVNGIIDGLPKGMLVAHKFGERGFSDSDIKQLHDCGIVYLQGSPYLICIMTRGKDFNELSKVIANLSAIVYKNAIAYK